MSRRAELPCAALVLCLLLTVVVEPALGQRLVVLARRVPVATLDSTLPAIPFETWLTNLGVPPAAIQWEENDCGEGGDGRKAPTCVEAILNLKADTTAHASLIIAGLDGATSQPAIWDLYIGAGRSVSSFKKLSDWAADVRKRRR